MPKDTTTKQTKLGEEGTVYISSLGTTPYYQTPSIDADKLFHLTKNVYASGLASKQKNMIFQEKFTIGAVNEDGEQDEKSQLLAESITQIANQPDVNLWGRMQRGFYDFFFWGPTLLNPVWDWVDNEYTMTKLRRLPPQSFRTTSPNADYRYSDILPGIAINGVTGEIEFWQQDDTGDLSQLSNVVMIKNPVSEGLAGEPIIVPLVPILEMLNYTWQAQMQKVNREGAPIVLLKITGAKGDDLQYGQTFLKNWGKNTGWQLRDNMEVIPLQFSENSTALDTIAGLEKMLIDHFSPSTFIQKEGNTLGGSAAPEMELWIAYIRGYHEWIAPEYARLFEPYLEANGYAGYTITIDIPCPSVDKSDLWLRQAQFALQAGIASPNELREYGMEAEPLDEEEWETVKAYYTNATPDQTARLLYATFGTKTTTINERRELAKSVGLNIEPLSDAEVQKLADEYARFAPEPGMTTATNIEKGKIAAAFATNKLDPYSVLKKKEQRRILKDIFNLDEEEEHGN